MDDVTFLEHWYSQWPDGDWEHQHGVTIETLDNPGWSLAADLEGTSLEGRTIDFRSYRDEQDWIRLRSDGLRFEAFGGPRNLTEILAAFRRFAESSDRQASIDDPSDGTEGAI